MQILKKLIILFLLLSLIGCSQLRDEEQHLYFVQITDSHYNEPKSEMRINKIIESVNKLPMKIECIVHTGDITQEKLNDTSIVNKSISLFNNFIPPIHFLPGNHDILKTTYESNKNIFINKFDSLITYHEYKGVVFLLVFTEPLAQSFSDDTYKPLLELEKKLKKSAGKPVIVFHHTPSVEDFYKNKMHEGWNKDIRDKWITLLNKYNVKAVIAGHFHRDEHHWLGNVPLYVCAPISAYWNRQLTYRIYEYKNGKIGYRTQYLE